MNTLRRTVPLIASLSLAALIAACGGGTGGTGVTSNNPTNAVSIGVMAKGSVIVNGVRFEDTTANISIDDTPKTSAALQNGMVVKVRGTVNDDGINGSASDVKALIEVRGTPTSVSPLANPPSLILLNQTVFADDQTVYSNLASFAAITISTPIEVHGLRDATGRIRATRIEANQLQMGDPTTDEIRGVVVAAPGANPTTFSIGAQAVNFVGGPAGILPAGASYQNGSVVEVYCSGPCISAGGVFQASRVKVEDAQDTVFQPSSGQRLEVEGIVSGFTTHPGNFSVAGTPVTTSTSTLFEGGIATDLADNIKVEAEGSWNGTRLVASKIEFKRSVIRLQGNVTAAGLTQFTLNVAGHSVAIETDSFTNGVVPPVSLDCVQIRGQRKVAASVIVTAGEIRTSCSSSDRAMMQAPVEAESPETTITLLGFALNISNPTDTPDKWVDVNGVGITRTAFFNAVTPAGTNAAGVSVPGTLVKVTFDTPGTTVRQAELED